MTVKIYACWFWYKRALNLLKKSLNPSSNLNTGRTEISAIIMHKKRATLLSLSYKLTGIFYLKILAKNVFISFHEAVSAAALYSTGIENFFPVSVAPGFVKACFAPA